MTMIIEHLKNHNPFEKNFFKRSIKLMIPSIAQALLESMISFVSVFLIGNYVNPNMHNNTEILNAFTAGMMVNFIFWNISSGIANGCSAYASQYNGAKNYEKLRETTRIRFLLSVIIGIILGLIVYGFSRDIVNLILHVNSKSSHDPITNQSLEYATNFLNILAISFPFQALAFSMIQTFRDTSNPKIPMIISIFILSIRIFFSYALIYGAMFFPRLGLNGSAWSMLIARSLEVILLYFAMYYTKMKFNPSWNWIKFEFILMIKMIKRMLPLLLNELLWTISITASVSAFALFGAKQFAGVQVAFQFNDLFFTIYSGLSTVASAVIGYLLGKNEIELAKSESIRITYLAIFICFFCSILLFSFSWFAPYIFFSKMDSLSKIIAKDMMMVASIAFTWNTLYTYFFYVVRTGGKVFWMSLIDSISTVLFVAIWSFVAAKYIGIKYNFDVWVVYLLVNLANIIRMMVMAYFYLKFNWAKNIINHKEKLI